MSDPKQCPRCGVWSPIHVPGDAVCVAYQYAAVIAAQVRRREAAESSLAAAERERDEARESRELTVEWYACRFARLKQFARERGLDEMLCILANGSADVHEPNTHAQILAQAKYRAETAESSLASSRAEAERLREALRRQVRRHSCEGCDACDAARAALGKEG